MNKKILLADDDQVLRDSIKEVIIQEGFEYIEAENGVQCLEKAESEKPDLILLDLAMPGLDGLSALKKLRGSNEWGANVPVILLTSLEPDDTINNYINQTNPSYYLVKSRTQPTEVIEKIKSVLKI